MTIYRWQLVLPLLLSACSQTMMVVQTQPAFVVEPEARDTTHRVELMVQSLQTGPELHDYAPGVVVNNFSGETILVDGIELMIKRVAQPHAPQSPLPLPVAIKPGTSAYFPLAFTTQDDAKHAFDHEALAMLLVHYKTAGGASQSLWASLRGASLD